MLKIIKNKALLFIMSISFFIGLMVFNIDLAPTEHFDDRYDSYQYHLLAKNLSEKGILSLDTVEPFNPSARRVPGYPVFLSIFYKIAGPDVTIVKFAQVLFGPCICLLIFLIGKDYFLNEKIGLFAAFFTSISPAFYKINNHLFVEGLFSLFLIASVYFTCLWFNKKKVQYSIGTGILWGGAGLIKPEAILLCLVVLPSILFYYTDKKKTLFHSVIAIFMVLLIILPWVYRNYSVTGKICLISGSGKTGEGKGMLRSYRIRAEQNPKILFRPERFKYLYGQNWKEAQKQYQAIKHINTVKNPEQSDIMYFLTNPKILLKYSAVKFITLYKPTSWSDTYGLPEDFSNYFKHSQFFKIAVKSGLLIFDFAILVFGGLGVVFLFSRGNRKLLFISTPVIYFTFVYTILHGVNRYRIPFLPLLILLGTWWLFMYFPKKTISK